MTPDQITQLRTLLNNAQVQVGATIEWAKYPGGAEEHGNKALSFLEQALALLPCPTCKGIGKIYCDECGGSCDFKAAGGNYTTMCHKCDLHGCIPCPDCRQHSP